jgi:hypothetical protein
MPALLSFHLEHWLYFRIECKNTDVGNISLFDEHSYYLACKDGFKWELDWTRLGQITSVRLSYGLDDRGLIPDRTGFFSSSQNPDRLWGSPSHLSSGYRGSFLGAKRPGVRQNHSPPFNIVVNNSLSLHSPPYVCIAWSVVKYQGQPYLTMTMVNVWVP